jgi:hypothetical protein
VFCKKGQKGKQIKGLINLMISTMPKGCGHKHKLHAPQLSFIPGLLALMQTLF